MIEAELADGRILEFPDGTDPEVIQATVKRVLGQETQEAPEDQQSAFERNFRPIDDAVRSVASGLTARFADEISAALNTALGQGEFNELLAGERARDEAIDPTTQAIGETVGAVGGALIPAGAAARGATMGQRIARSAGAGAGFGAAFGAGGGEGLEDRAQQALEGGALGAVTGAIAPPALEALGATGRGIAAGARRVVAPFRGAVTPDQEAARRVSQAIAIDRRGGEGISPTQLIDAQRAGQPITNIERGGETTRALARSAANVSPSARRTLEEPINARFETQSERVTTFVRDLVGNTDTIATREALERAARTQNRPAYSRAYKDGDAGLHSDELERLTGAPAIVTAMKDTLKKGKNRAVADGFGEFNPGATVTEAGEVVFNRAQNPRSLGTLQFWDGVKRSLDDAENRARRAGGNEEAGTLRALNSQLRETLDELVPSYNAARAGAARFFGSRDALDAGANFVNSKMKPAEAKRLLGKMNDAERTLFSEGFASELIDLVNKAPDRADIIKRIAASPQARAKLNVALGPQRAKEIETFLDVERLIDSARTAVQGNSTTARQFAELMLGGGVGSGVFAASQGGQVTPSGLVVAAIVGAGVKRGIDRRVADRVANLLVSDNPASLRKGLRAVANNRKFRQSVQTLDIPTAIGATRQAIEVNEATQ